MSYQGFVIQGLCFWTRLLGTNPTCSIVFHWKYETLLVWFGEWASPSRSFLVWFVEWNSLMHHLIHHELIISTSRSHPSKFDEWTHDASPHLQWSGFSIWTRYKIGRCCPVLTAVSCCFSTQDIEYLKLYSSRYGREEGLALIEKTGMYLGPDRYTLDHGAVDVMRGEVYRTCRS